MYNKTEKIALAVKNKQTDNRIHTIQNISCLSKPHKILLDMIKFASGVLQGFTLGPVIIMRYGNNSREIALTLSS